MAEMLVSSKKKHILGQTLLEAVVALSALLITIAAVTVVVLTSVNNSTFIRNQNLANKYAQAGMEYIRGMKNVSYNEFKNLYGDYCLGDENRFVAGLNCPVNVAGQFIRKASFSTDQKCGENSIKLVVSVAWSSSKCSQQERWCHKSEMVSCFMLQDQMSQP